MIETGLSFITKVSLKCLVKLVFFLCSHWVASGLLSSHMIPPFCSFLAPITLTPVVGSPSCVVIFITAMLAFSTKLPHQGHLGGWRVHLGFCLLVFACCKFN